MVAAGAADVSAISAQGGKEFHPITLSSSSNQEFRLGIVAKFRSNFSFSTLNSVWILLLNVKI